MTTTPVPVPGGLPLRNADVLGYNQRDWAKIPFLAGGDVLVSLSADNAYTHLLNLPALGGGTSVIQRVDPSLELALKFYGIGANNSQYTLKLWGLKTAKGRSLAPATLNQSVTEWLGDLLGAATVTLGQATAAVGTRLIPSNAKWADTVAWTDYSISPGVLQMGDATDCAIVSVFDQAPAYAAYVLEFLAGSATAYGGFFSV